MQGPHRTNRMYYGTFINSGYFPAQRMMDKGVCDQIYPESVKVPLKEEYIVSIIFDEINIFLKSG